MGSKSDLKFFDAIKEKVEKTQISYDLKILSAHRDTEKLINFLKENEKDYKVILAAAGFSAALPGLVASISRLPVIGIPLATSPIKIDALFSMIQMPKGVPLGVVSHDKTGFINGILYALRIMGEYEKHDEFKKSVLS